MIEQNDWTGVFPAITTPFGEDLTIDHVALAEHVRWQADSGCRGIVALGSLGEASTLEFSEKLAILKTCREALGGRVPLVAGVAGLSTRECVELAREAHNIGCDALMALPPYVYRGDWRETAAHFGAVIGATRLSCMLYNNPVAYGTDIVPAQIAELAARYPNLHAVKESSGDIRRVTEIRRLLGSRLNVFIGMDDLILEGAAMGAVGWIAGLVNAFPAESVRLVDLAISGKMERARALYEWFLPLLRLDTVPKFIQMIKLVQQETGHGSEIVRPPRLPLSGTEREDVLKLVRRAGPAPL